MSPVFDLIRPPLWRGGLIVASPHSGRVYPPGFVEGSRLSLKQLRSSEDAYVDQLAAAALPMGAVVLTAHVARAVVDLNRARDDLDPLAVDGVPPARTRSARTLAGLGVIPRVVAHGRAIFDRPIARQLADKLLDRYWQPYHDQLALLMDEAVARFGRAVLIDLHSMPRVALSHLAPRPEVVLGDRHGRSAARWVRGRLCTALEGEGLHVRMNTPFAGAYIAKAYGQPERDRHVLQLEIDRSLYMDEGGIQPHGGLDALTNQLGRVFGAMQDGAPAVAAE